jgi:predicted acylesterase/phospholipase RssA
MKGLCLSGGGARGSIETGMIQAYLDQHGSYDQLYGTSVGALNGVFLHQGDFETLKSIWANIRNNQIYNWAPWNLFTSGASLFSSAPLAKMINKYLNIEKIRANLKPFYVSASHVNPLRSICIPLASVSDADMARWVLCSASAPVGFPVQNCGDHQYTDGGPTSNYNIQTAIKNGCTDITLLACSTMSNKRIKNIIDMIEWNFNAQAYDQLSREADTIRLLEKANDLVALTVYQPPANIDLPGMLDFNIAGKGYQKWFDFGYNLLKKPTIQYRRMLQAGKPKWMVYR